MDEMRDLIWALYVGGFAALLIGLLWLQDWLFDRRKSNEGTTGPGSVKNPPAVEAFIPGLLARDNTKGGEKR